jgi:predicted DNA-binding transcriptional regulator AlpA
MPGSANARSSSVSGDAQSLPDPLLTVDELSTILRVPRSWICGHLDLLPTVRLGRYVRFRRSEVELFLQQHETCK